ncbi:hypothetical protein KU74_12285 [Pectobacterium brasiliense]|uniref:Uncharacterized protein n=1 Tax=Pectobacterium brasiliense TaxID=180957 RepID=A0A0M2F0T5_9GAMM|nr:hypothetical protein KU74_12285 [Pectobacterium brasiliense]GLY59283.1 hypothetical protein Pcaca05_01410 [Pectobacterium carotovorum subsp. carotovorum]
MIFTIAYVTILLWSGWCVFSDHVKDGVVGKLMYSALSISCMGALIGGSGSDRQADSIILLCIAMIGIRHFVLKQINLSKN